MDRLIERLERLGSPRIALVGDFILDCYMYGNAERISPEAPVPVLHVVRRESRVGGAGSVAAAVPALGGRVDCIGVIGHDAHGEQLTALLREAGADPTPLAVADDRGTSVKTRFVGLAQHRSAQQLLRADEEVAFALPDELRTRIRAALRERLALCDAVVLEDYGKGVLSDEGTPELIGDAREAGKRVYVDPALGVDYARYEGATLLTPNRYEASLAAGVEVTDEASLRRATERIFEITGAEALMVTMDKEGVHLLHPGKPAERIAQNPRQVYDVTGAGDQFLATVAVACSQGLDYVEAARLGNVAGGLEVERFGVVPISRQEILDELGHMVGLRAGKVMSREVLAREVERRRRAGERIVFTNGCFDLLHMGHVRYLQQARQLGACLVVAVNSDDSVRRLKGPSRPVIPQQERAEMLGSLECVDCVTIFDEDTPKLLLELLKPDVLVKGGTTAEVVGREIVEAAGGEVLTLEATEGWSTTDIINRIGQKQA